MTGTLARFRIAALVAATTLFAASLVAASGQTAVAATAQALASQNPSPYATPGCLALEPQPGSLNYLNSEVEPQVAVDPTNPSHLVGAWQQDRWSNGGAHGLVAGYSNDGGASWHVSPQPFSACYHASGFPGAYLNYQRASDPWVSIGPGAPAGSPSTSTVYSVSISFDQTAFPAIRTRCTTPSARPPPTTAARPGRTCRRSSTTRAWWELRPGLATSATTPSPSCSTTRSP